MRKIYPLLLFLFSMFTITSQAQTSYDKVNFGIGFGADFGGIGGNITVYPQKNIGLFFGGGYAFAGFGYNAGVKYRFLPSKPSSQFTPYLLAMYGYNAAVHVSNATQYDKMFYGPTFGIGCDLGSHEVGKGVFTFALLVPIRSSEPNDYIDHLRNDYGVEFKNKLIPIGLSFGYKFNLD